MTNIGILAGGGKLPLAIGKNLIKLGYNIQFFCIEPYAKILDYKEFNNIETIKLNSLTNILRSLNNYNIGKIIMAGYVQRPSLRDIKFDFNTIKLIKEYSLQSKGDDKLLNTISSFFIKNNFDIFNWKNLCRDLFVYDDCITTKKPNKYSSNNLKKGLKIFKALGKVDLSQSLIVQNSIILGIEASEGTDELIKRCHNYKKKGDKGILLKLSKYKQNNNIDLPVIGLDTVKLLSKYNYDGIYLEKKHCIILEKSEVINYCNNNSLFISGVEKI